MLRSASYTCHGGCGGGLCHDDIGRRLWLSPGGRDRKGKAMPRNIDMRVKAFGLKAMRRTALAGLVLVSAVSASLGWDPPLALAATGTWSATGSTATGRYLHTATLLPSGKVLVAGGVSSGSGRASAELYNPATGTWSATGSMTTAHFSHTVTLLHSGKVLVAAGFSNSIGAVTASELYDPVTGTWSATGSMSTGRADHTATLLPSGKVLVAGGYDGSIVLASAELYDPAGSPGPSCRLTRSGTNGSGHTFIDITVQDPNSGLRQVQVTESNNASVVVPTFAVGTKSPQVVVATKIDQSKTSHVALQVTNVAGLVTNCDPILTEVGRDGPGGVPRAETFRHIPQGESQVTISNGSPGLRRLRLVVDGHIFEVAGLTDGETRRIDVSSAMRRGNNTITLIAQSKRDGTASILIADR
jgi:hypothetical protein